MKPAEAKCLPGCRTLGELTMHVPGCPKVATAKPAEPPKCAVCRKAPAWGGGDWCQSCSGGKEAPPAERQGSEEPIDFDTEDREALRAEVEELREYIRRREKSGRWGEERAALRAEVERLKKLHSDHCSNPICEGPRS